MTFRRLHPAHVPRQSRRRCLSAVDVSRVSIPGLFHLVLAEVREPIESFLISDENAIGTSYESSQSVHPSWTDFISALFPLRKIFKDSLLLPKTVLLSWQVPDDTIKILFKCARNVKIVKYQSSDKLTSPILITIFLNMSTIILN